MNKNAAKPYVGPVARVCRLGTATLALSALLGGTALAQNSLNPSTRVATPPPANGAPINPVSSVPPLPVNEALLPDFGGYRQWLRDRGISFGLDNVNEFDGIVSGRNKGSSNAGQYSLESDIDWERLAGITGFSTHAVAVGRYGIPASRMFGDNLDPSQEIYGAGGNVAIHMVYFYGEETVANGRADLAFGRIPVLNDFASSPLYCNFQNNAFCGNPKASSDNTDVSSYPDASWAARIRVRPTRLVYVQTGIFFNQNNIYSATAGYRSGFRFNSSNITGETFPVEAGIEPFFGPNKLPGHYKIGFIYDNSNRTSNYSDINGDSFAASGLPARTLKGTYATYALADQMLLRNGPGATDGLIAFAGYYHNSDHTSTRASQAEIGLIDHDFWKARPQDGIAVAFSYLKVASGLIKTEEVQQELGLPITGTGGQFYDGYTPGVQSHTMNIEANYQIHVYRGITFAPDFQYFVRPNAQANLPNAALLGFKTHIQLF